MIKRSKEQWRALFAEHKSSGLTAAAFCRERSLCPKYFALRKRQLSESSASFVEVKSVQSMPSTVSIKITEVNVPLNMISETLVQLLK